MAWRGDGQPISSWLIKPLIVSVLAGVLVALIVRSCLPSEERSRSSQGWQPTSTLTVPPASPAGEVGQLPGGAATGEAVGSSEPDPPAAAPEATEPGALPATGASPSPSSGSAAFAGGRFLTDLTPVRRSGDVKLDKTIAIDGISYLHSIRYTCFTFCNEPTASIEYDLGRSYRTLHAVIGVVDTAEESDQVGTFTALVDGVTKGTWSAKLGQPVTIDVDVSGGLRLRLDWGREGTVAGSPADTVLAGANSAWGISNGLPDLAWGSPTLSS